MKIGDRVTNALPISLDWAAYDGGPSILCKAEQYSNAFESTPEQKRVVEGGRTVKHRPIGDNMFVKKTSKVKSIIHLHLPIPFVIGCHTGHYALLELLPNVLKVQDNVVVLAKKKYFVEYPTDFFKTGIAKLFSLDSNNNRELFPTMEYHSKIVDAEMVKTYIKFNSIISENTIDATIEAITIKFSKYNKVAVIDDTKEWPTKIANGLSAAQLNIWIERNGVIGRIDHRILKLKK